MTVASSLLRLVRQQCKDNGVKFSYTRKTPHVLGGFSDSDKSLSISTEAYTSPKNDKVRKVPKEEMAIVALHEMVHMWQWRRKDPNFSLKIDGIDAYGALAEYSDGEKYYRKDFLRKCLPSLVAIEFEAEMTSIRIARSAGLELKSYSKWVKEAKAYCFAWYVLVETGIWPSRQVRVKWRKHISTALDWDLTKSLLSKLCQITIDNKTPADLQWVGKKCTKHKEQ